MQDDDLANLVLYLLSLKISINGPIALTRRRSINKIYSFEPFAAKY